MRNGNCIIIYLACWLMNIVGEYTL